MESHDRLDCNRIVRSPEHTGKLQRPKDQLPLQPGSKNRPHHRANDLHATRSADQRGNDTGQDRLRLGRGFDHDHYFALYLGRPRHADITENDLRLRYRLQHDGLSCVLYPRAASEQQHGQRPGVERIDSYLRLCGRRRNHARSSNGLLHANRIERRATL
jgi:hypothetical protein